MIDHSGFPLYSTPSDYEEFPIVIHCSNGSLPTVGLKWCKENIPFRDWCFDPYVDGGYDCRFRYKEDAMMFRLKFPV